MCRRLQLWPGMSRTQVQVFKVNWRSHGFDSWAPPIEHYLVLSFLSVAYIHLYCSSHRRLPLGNVPFRNLTQQPKDCFWARDLLLERFSFSELIICCKKFLEMHYSSLQSKADSDFDTALGIGLTPAGWKRSLLFLSLKLVLMFILCMHVLYD